MRTHAQYEIRKSELEAALVRHELTLRTSGELDAIRLGFNEWLEWLKKQERKRN